MPLDHMPVGEATDCGPEYFIDILTRVSPVDHMPVGEATDCGPEYYRHINKGKPP